MIKRLVAVVLTVLTVLFSACSSNNGEEELSVAGADSVAITRANDAHIMFAAAGETLDEMKNLFQNLKFEKTEDEMNVSSVIKICFYNEENEVAIYNVDENNLFWLNNDQETYRVSGSSFSYESVLNIYEESKS